MDRSLDIYLGAAANEDGETESEIPLLTIGKLARDTGTVNSTLRYWVKVGLLDVADTTPAGYQLFERGMIERVDRIRKLQKKRFTLTEIKAELSRT